MQIELAGQDSNLRMPGSKPGALPTWRPATIHCPSVINDEEASLQVVSNKFSPNTKKIGYRHVITLFGNIRSDADA
jgi:hypothetical protein